MATSDLPRRSPSPMDYEAACKQALHSQGLDLVLDRLAREGITPDVEQTGGFIMALRYDLNDGTLFVVGGEGTDHYLVSRMTEATWNGEGDEPITEDYGIDREAVADLLTFRRPATPNRNASKEK